MMMTTPKAFRKNAVRLGVEFISLTRNNIGRVIIVAHGNSLRVLVKYLDNVSYKDIVALKIPTGIPLVYELDRELRPIKHYYLGNSELFKEQPPLFSCGIPSL